MSTLTIQLSQPRIAPDVGRQPRVRLHSWRIFEVHEHTHLVGFLENGVTCRVTTAVDSVIAASRQVHTGSGRIYELDGLPANDFQALLVINARLCQLFQTIDADVTMNYWQTMQAAMS